MDAAASAQHGPRQPGVPEQPCLAVDGVSKSFGGIAAVRDVSFRLAPGEVLGFIGPNGSGKTTLLNIINGVHHTSTGSIRYFGERIDRSSPSRILRLGISRTFQAPRVFDSLTVWENMELPTIETGRVDAAEIRAILSSLGLDQHAHRVASRMSGGQQKLLEFARAMVTRPRLVLMDEPFGGVHPVIKREMHRAIVRWSQERQTAFIIVSHEIPDLLELADRVVCLAEGTVIAAGTGSEVTQNERVVEAYLGRQYSRSS
ncbi:MAG: ABC transporter ATP-binding protein [Alicyclobacillus sp.]|nr:ABC transporter ATP-binding protein [Alicyclobacillus sp.]